jgi:hypothetical protein
MRFRGRARTIAIEEREAALFWETASRADPGGHHFGASRVGLGIETSVSTRDSKAWQSFYPEVERRARSHQERKRSGTMEKLIYVMTAPADEIVGRVERVAEAVVPVARSIGGERMALLVPDQAEEIRERCPARIGGDFASLAAVFECWLPTLDSRPALEEVLSPRCGALWGYLVTESTLDPCPYTVEDGGRVPGVTQWGINDKPAAVELEDFYREWAVHSKLSFDLHPHRDSYIRNAITRRLTPAAPQYLGIVLERFPTLETFTDESLYFGDPGVVKEMFAHVPSFYAFESAITGGLSEFRWA